MEELLLVGSLVVLFLAQGITILYVKKAADNAHAVHLKNVRTLIQEWNKIVQTINTLTQPYMEGRKPDTGPVRGQYPHILGGGERK